MCRGYRTRVAGLLLGTAKQYLETPGHHSTPHMEKEETTGTPAGAPPITGHTGSRLKKEHKKARVRGDDQVRVGTSRTKRGMNY